MLLKVQVLDAGPLLVQHYIKGWCVGKTSNDRFWLTRLLQTRFLWKSIFKRNWNTEIATVVHKMIIQYFNSIKLGRYLIKIGPSVLTDRWYCEINHRHHKLLGKNEVYQSSKLTASWIHKLWTIMQYECDFNLNDSIESI